MKTMKLKRAMLMLTLLVMTLSAVTGGTIAWFTDSVNSANNVIKAGNLDIELYHDNRDKVTADTELFTLPEPSLWEPGAVAWENLEVVNKGNLALKYEMVMNTANENTVDGNGLSTALKVGIVKDGVALDAERDAVINAVEEWKTFAEFKATGKLLPEGSDLEVDGATEGSETYGVVIYWQPGSDDNKWNVNNGKEVSDYAETQNNSLHIDLGIKLVATQLDAEADSFGKDYDENATFVSYDHQVSTLAELKAAFAEGGTVLLEDNIEFDKITAIEPGAEVYLDMNGKTITVDRNTASNTLIWVKEGAKLVVDGNGTFDLGDVSTMAIFAPYGELVIENGNFIRNEITADEVTDKTTGLFMGCKVVSSNVVINGGYFDPGYYDENAANIEAILAGTETLPESEEDKNNRDKPGDKNEVRVALKDNVSVVLNHSGYGTFKVYGGTFVGANPAWGDEGCMLPTTPNYLRPWSYYQGALLDGQTFNENGLVIPDGYTITQSTSDDGRPVYTVNYSK